MSRSASSSFLDPAAIAQGETLGLLAQTVVEGYRAGEHRSRLPGFAVEFAQYREYSAGDDMRHIDWKVLGRKERYYIKQYEQDTSLAVHLLLDGSESMNYGGGSITKLHYAKSLAACLTYLVLQQRDAISLTIFDTETRRHIPCADNLAKMPLIMEQLAGFTAEHPTRLGAALSDLAGRVPPRGLIVIFSDLFDDEASFLHNLQELRYRGHEVAVFHVLDADELEFPFTGRMEFIGLENVPSVETIPEQVRESYLAHITALQTRMRTACEQVGAHYLLANTRCPLGETLSTYLLLRQQKRLR